MAKKQKAEKVKKTKKKSGRIKVVATRLGYYGEQRRPAGSKFSIKNESEMGSWMEREENYVEPTEGEEEEIDDGEGGTGDEDVL